MVTTWIGYCLLVSGLLALAAFASERGLEHYRKPVRWVWVGAILGSALIPAFAFLAPALFRALSPATSADLPAMATMVSARDLAPLAAVASGGVDPATASAILGWVWGLSVAFIGLHLARTYRRLRSEMREWTPGMILDSPVLLSSDRGPAVVGVGRAVIVMPQWIAELEEDLLRLVFLHEREHQRAGDHRLYAVGIAALVSMPWNVILWWQVARLRLAIEFDCDRRVLGSGVARRDYAEALLAVGSRVSEPLFVAAAFAERKPSVERRLRRMTEPVAKLRAPRTLGTSGIAALAIILVLGAPPPPGLQMVAEEGALVEFEDVEFEDFDDDGDVDIRVTQATPTRVTDADRVRVEDVDGDGDVDIVVAETDATPVAETQLMRPAFIPYDRPPELRNRDEVMQAIQMAYPRDLQEAGVGGSVGLWLYVDEQGAVDRHVTKTSSGHPRLDEAAMGVAPTMRFKPAVNRDRPTPVWVSQFITFTSPAPPAGAPDDPLIVIDGVIQAPSAKLENLGELAIDHIEIVKGQAARSLYGDRARNGVVQITTKKKAEADARPPDRNER